MRQAHRRLVPTALLLTALTLAGCTPLSTLIPGEGEERSGSVAPIPDPTGAAATGSISITWLATTGDGSGTTGTTEITKSAPQTPGDFRVEFSANEVDGAGDQHQAGGWNAAIISTLLLAQPLEGEFRFETDGRIDGPSAGALTTAGLIAISRGDAFLDGVTMTGTINSTGTIGPVGGIPDKIQAAADAGFTTVLIPMGQRTSADSQGNAVDVVKEGDRLGVDVIETTDIFEAYEHLTGQNIDVPGVSRDPRLSDAAYDKIAPQTDAALARIADARARFERLPAEVQQIFVDTGIIALVDDRANQALDLQRQGLQAGAYSMAAQGAGFSEATAGVGEMLVPLYTQGIDGLGTIFAQAMDTSVASAEFFAFLDRLSAYVPKNVADVEGLINGYAGAFDAYSLLTFAQRQVADIEGRWNSGSYASIDEMFAQLVMPVYYSQLARAQVANTEAAFEVGRDNPGATIDPDVDIAQIGDFFRRGADANFAAFQANVAAPLAEANGYSTDLILGYLAASDTAIAAAMTQGAIEPAIADYIGGDKPNAQYATLGYGLNNYVRNQGLLDKYYNNAVLDEYFTVVDVQYDAVLARSLDLGRQMTAGEIQTLADDGTEPVLSTASYEAAGLTRAGGSLDQFEASIAYQGAFVSTRTLSYLSGLYLASAG